jgi:hypothetical protein
MIIMAMGKNEEVQIIEADSQLLCMRKEKSGQAGIEEDLLPPGFNEKREPGLTTEIPVSTSGIIDKDNKGELAFHRRISLRMLR